MTLNIIDCVNSGAIKAESQAVGILAWIGPWNGGRIDNVTVNIDRCRNLNTDFTCGRKIGIVGSRGDGRGSNKATNVTNCFATVGTNWFPIAYLRLSGENVTGHGNYYIEDSGDKGKSFFKKDSRKLTTVKPNSTTGNWEKADKQGSDSAYKETYWNPSSEKVKAHRLYIGYNVTDKPILILRSCPLWPRVGTAQLTVCGGLAVLHLRAGLPNQTLPISRPTVRPTVTKPTFSMTPARAIITIPATRERL